MVGPFISETKFVLQHNLVQKLSIFFYVTRKYFRLEGHRTLLQLLSSAVAV